jgi:NADH:ubiquinone oxidoreductase subunit F (NADH-binding)
MQRAVSEAYEAGFLGSSVAGSSFAFDVSVVPGMGSYVCGEETALINAIEGFRGEVSIRPPFPAKSGLYGQPTVVNNVETLVNIPVILERGAEAYAARGTEYSSGTKALCLNSGFERPGIVEVEFGISLREVIDEAGGAAGGMQLEAVMIGGPMGSVLAPEKWDAPVCYGHMNSRDIQLGHGGLVALTEETNYAAVLAHLIQFMKDESCGKCVPCRLGSKYAWDLVQGTEIEDIQLKLQRTFEIMKTGSLCAFGHAMPHTMKALIDLFGDRIFSNGGPS